MPFKRSIHSDPFADTGIRSFVEGSVEAHGQVGERIQRLLELVPVVRSRLSVPTNFSDDAVFADLNDIARESDQRERWRIAFSSDLGQVIASGGRDLNTALNTLVALVPRNST